jgi:formimidoylglutamate deiminase
VRIPGFANVHSHAFQRLLRGRVQKRDPSRPDTFWTWREAMYAVAGRLDLEGLEATARRTFIECLEAGYTAVGEFHYLHHRPDGGPWPDPLAASRALLRASRQAGIRMTLLWTVYARGGFDTPPTPVQRRFCVSSIDEVREALDRLAPVVDGARSAVGLALHSVRAVPREWLGPLAEEARSRGLVLHVHAAEQPAEVEATMRVTGLSPIGLLASEGVLGPRTTLVHATWLDDDDVQRIASTSSTVCVCPTTEGDLGDGVPRAAELHARGVLLSIGSDSHAVIDPFSEVRMLEYGARAATGRRCILINESGEVAPALKKVAHDNGYRSLDLEAGGDVVLDDGHPVLEGVSGDDDRLAAVFTAGHPGLVRQVEVAGEVVVLDGVHVER